MPTSPVCRTLAVLADANRQRILDFLLVGERSVSDIAAVIPVSRSAVSQHLNTLARAGLVLAKRDGRVRRYRLVPALFTDAARHLGRWAGQPETQASGDGTDEVDGVVLTILKAWPETDAVAVAFFTRVHLLARLMRDRLAYAARAHEVTAPDAVLLGTLRRLGPPYASTPTQLSQRAVLSAPTMTKRLHQLERRGLIERQTSADDRRVRFIVLTAKGADVTDRIIRAQMADNLAGIGPLSRADLRQLANGLRTVLRSFEAPPRRNDT